jgi:hypothetical protein
MTTFAKAEDAALESDLLALTAIVRERRGSCRIAWPGGSP